MLVCACLTASSSSGRGSSARRLNAVTSGISRILSGSDVGAGLPAVDRNRCSIYETRLLRANEGDDPGHLFDRAKPPERHLAPDEVGDGIGIRLLAPVPPAALPED